MDPPAGSPGRQVLRGSLIITAARWTVRLIGLASTIVLARLLSPGDFGIIGVAMIAIGFIEAVAERGQNLVLIRMTDPQPEHFDAAWTLQIIVGAGLAAVIAAAAPLIASALAEPRVLPVMLALSLRPLLNGFINVGMATNRMQFRFGRDFLFIFLQKVAAVGICIGLAVVLRSYWALAIAMIADRIVAVALSYVLHPYRPRLSLARLGEIWRFSGWMLAADFGDFLSRQADAIFVAGTAPGPVLGQYRVAADVATMPTFALALPIAYASFPAYARLTGDVEALRRASLQGLAAVAALALPAGIGIALVAEDLVAVVLGAQWSDAAPFVRWLALAGTLTALRINLVTVVNVTGRSRLSALLGWADVALLAGGLALLLPTGGAEQAAVTRAAALAAMLPAYGAAYRMVTAARWRDLAAALWRPALAALAMAAALIAAPPLAAGQAARLAADVAGGAAAYALATIVLWRLAGRPAGPERGLIDALAGLIRRAPVASTVREPQP